MKEYEEFLKRIIARDQKISTFSINIISYLNRKQKIEVRWDLMNKTSECIIDIYFGDILEQQFIDKSDNI